MQAGREIKFRAWMKHKSKMDFNIVLSPEGRVCDMQHGEICATYLPEDAIVMQFTGLKDKNGKKIYEGDIIQSSHIGNLKVHYDPGFACYAVSNKRNSTDLMSYMYEYGLLLEVIGNIYEDPELLEAI